MTQLTFGKYKDKYLHDAAVPEDYIRFLLRRAQDDVYIYTRELERRARAHQEELEARFH
jgi:predicted GIY-YIG superfamily endonuclease